MRTLWAELNAAEQGHLLCEAQDDSSEGDADGAVEMTPLMSCINITDAQPPAYNDSSVSWSFCELVAVASHGVML